MESNAALTKQDYCAAAAGGDKRNSSIGFADINEDVFIDFGI